MPDHFIDGIAISHEPGHRTIDLVGTIGILVGQEIRDDHAALHIETDVKLLPATAFPTMLGSAPFTLPKDLQSRAV